MRLPVTITKVHKWIGLIIGIQVILWIAGGVIMSWFPLNKVRGEHNMAELPPAPLEASGVVPISALLDRIGQIDQIDRGQPRSVELHMLMGGPVYQVTLDDGDPVLFDARDGARLSPLPQALAQRIALADFKGDAGVVTARLLDETNLEYRRKDLPVWQFILDDPEDTHLYVSPFSGKVVARRNATWRLYDFFWMLHIMDYKNRTNFNHPLIVWASIIALVLSVSGIWLMFYRFSRRDFRWLGATRRRGGG